MAAPAADRSVGAPAACSLGGEPCSALPRLSIAHPVRALLVWAALALALALIGLGVSDRLSPSMVVVPGTDSSRAQHLADAEFGPSVLVPILLEGPEGTLERQGPVLVRRLRAERDIRVLSAWDGGSTGEELRPQPGAAMIVAAVARTEEAMVDWRQAEVEAIVDRAVAGPVRAHVTGQPALDIAMKDAALDATRRAELLSMAILFGVLLLFLRAPVAALLLAALGAATSLVGFGAMALLGRVIDVDATAVALGSMTGLALGVGYGLLVYRRWVEEEERGGGDVTDRVAAAAAVETTGRAVLIGGTALTLSLALAPLIAPTEILTSLGVGVLLCSMLGIGAAVVVMPAVIVLAGRRLQAGSFPAPRPLRRAWERLAGGGGRWVVRNAIGAGAVATAVLAVLALPALSFETGPPSVKLLPESSAARADFEEVARVMGPGWPTPFNVVVASTTRPITDRALLRELDRFQGSIAKDPRVASVVGPGELRATSRDLAVLPRKLRESTKLLKGGKRDLGRLEAGLGKAGAGAQQLRAGLESAAGGAGRLEEGSGAAGSGAGRLRAGLDQARSGASQISAGLNDALTAARKLRDGAGQALAGSRRITGGLGQAVEPVQTGAPIVKDMAGNVAAGAQAVHGAQGSAATLSGQLDEALGQLQSMKTGTDDPAYQAAVVALGSAAPRPRASRAGSPSSTPARPR
jgi:putative drug exporter of the RND superfamily